MEFGNVTMTRTGYGRRIESADPVILVSLEFIANGDFLVDLDRLTFRADNGTLVYNIVRWENNGLVCKRDDLLTTYKPE